MIRKSIGVIGSLLMVWIIGCGGEEAGELALARQDFEAGLYSKAEIRLDQFVQEYPQNVEAYCLLATVYNRQRKTQKLGMAAGKLRDMGKPAVDKLISIMRYEPNMAEDMAEVLAIVGEQAVGSLIPAMGDATERVRESAVSVLSRIGIPAVERLKKALESPDVSTRAGASRALGNIGDETAIEALTKKLEDESQYVRIEAAAALYKLGDKGHVDTITNGLDADNLLARRAAAAATQDVVEEPPIEPLLKAAEDRDTEVKAAAIRSLGKTKDEKAIAPLIEALGSEDDTIRRAAAGSLKEMGGLAVMPLVELISHEKDESTLYKALQVLGDIGDKRAVKALEKVYEEDTRQFVKREAAIALNKIE